MRAAGEELGRDRRRRHGLAVDRGDHELHADRDAGDGRIRAGAGGRCRRGAAAPGDAVAGAWTPLMMISDGAIAHGVHGAPPLVYVTVMGRPCAAAVAACRSVETSRGRVVPDGSAVDADDDVAVVQAGELGGRSRLDVEASGHGEDDREQEAREDRCWPRCRPGSSPAAWGCEAR